MSEAEPRRKPERALYLVRHGQYLMDGGAQAGQLTELGRRQARLLARQFDGVEVDSIVSSDVTRAVETARILAAELRVEHGRRHAVLREVVPGAVAGMVVPFDTRREGRDRIERVWRRFFKPSGPRNEIVVCHGNLIRSLVCKFFGCSSARFPHLVAYNTGVTCFSLTRQGPRLVNFNAVDHLRPTERSVM